MAFQIVFNVDFSTTWIAANDGDEIVFNADFSTTWIAENDGEEAMGSQRIYGYGSRKFS